MILCSFYRSNSHAPGCRERAYFNCWIFSRQVQGVCFRSDQGWEYIDAHCSSQWPPWNGYDSFQKGCASFDAKQGTYYQNTEMIEEVWKLNTHEHLWIWNIIFPYNLEWRQGNSHCCNEGTYIGDQELAKKRRKCWCRNKGSYMISFIWLFIDNFYWVK